MDIGTVISAIVIGAIVGALGRMVIHGRQRASVWSLVVVGIVAALVGSSIAAEQGLGMALTFVIEVLMAGAGVYFIAGRGDATNGSAADHPSAPDSAS